VAAVEVVPRTGVLGERFHLYLNPGRAIPANATRVHGISNDDVKDAQTFEQIAEGLSLFLSDSILLIHNSNFDTGMLNAAFGRVGDVSLDRMNVHVIDSVQVAKDALPLLPSYTLDAIMDHAGISRAERVTHGALLDVELLSRTLPYLASQYDTWQAMEESDCAIAVEQFVGRLRSIAQPLLVDAIPGDDRIGHDLGSVVTVSRWLPKMEERLKALCEPLVTQPGWVCKHLFARVGATDIYSYKAAAEALLGDADLSAFETQSFVYRVKPSLDEAVQALLDEASADLDAAKVEHLTNCVVQAFATVKQFKNRFEKRREILRRHFLGLVKKGFDTDLVDVTESSRRSTDYHGALDALAPGADLSPYARTHVRLAVGERSPERCEHLFGVAP
jgi:DNA polymerase III epsilon subunit family exonuclease